MTHRLVWEQVNGPIPEGFDVDHINGDKHDNRLENLRLATRSQNMCNRSKTTKNTSGLKGLSWDKHTGRWRSFLCLRGHQTSKRFNCMLDAVAWLYRKRRELHGEFACN